MAVAFGAITQAAGFGPPALNGPTVTGSDTYGLFFVACDVEAVSVTWDGVAMTKLQGGSAGFASADYALFGIVSPASEGAIVVTDPATPLNNNYLASYYTGVGSVRGSGEGGATGTTATLSQTTVAGDFLAGALYCLTEDITVTVGTGRGTQQSDADGGRARAVDNEASGVSTAITGTMAGSTPWISVGAVLAPVAAGPTIDTQPEADTVLINGDAARASASFTVAATTSGGALSYQWELETSVGGGTYANVANGSGATWAGATGTNLTATFTIKTLTGRRVRCVVTDDNGSTTTNAVALTVYTGPVLNRTSGTTDASGEDEPTITSDYPNADGEFTVVTATAGDVEKTVSLHYEVP